MFQTRLPVTNMGNFRALPREQLGFELMAVLFDRS